MVRTVMLALPRPGEVIDPHRAMQVRIELDAWHTLDLLGSGPKPASRLWHETTADCASAQLVTLAGHGLVHLRFPRGSLARQVLSALRRGTDHELRMLTALSLRRVHVPVCRWPSITARCLLVVLRAWAGVLALAGAAMFTTALALTGSPLRALPPALAPLVLVTTIAVHEAAHLIAVRTVTGNPGCGALLVGLFRLSVIRPELTGRALRIVAAAGPSAGFSCGLLACPLLAIDPLCGLTALLSCALHLANLTPRAPDGQQLWYQRPTPR
ncbi:hypothetical protein [Frankia sp. Cas4]|uniref:hypothetical protein n=1 Tax=Frankia sp. Cas4 TaxID=3073927 RepID=UPI002AD24E4D|nr:hypothetical protein [Frankia sp. Cas4]